MSTYVYAEDIFDTEDAKELRQIQHQSSIPIERSTIWYQTSWFRVLLILLGFASLYLIHQWRIRHFKIREKHLQMLVDKRAEELSEAHLEVKERNREVLIAQQQRSQFLASINHEIRIPLTSILGYAELINSKKSSAEVKKHTHTIIRTGKHLLQVINDISDLAKIEAGKIDTESVDSSIQELIEEVQDYINILADQKGLYFKAYIDEFLPSRVHTDPIRLKQVLLNLCGNAVKFTESGGVSLSVLHDHSNDSLLFIIEDTGVGMSEEQVSKLFTAFIQAEPNFSPHYGGTGLGLYLSKQITDMLGGHIHVDSEVGMGTRFTMSIPRRLSSTLSENKAPAHPISAQPLAKDIDSMLWSANILESKQSEELELIEGRPSILTVDDKAEV